ncbi:hypothetical protein [Halotalea alkalilenta]|uniref:DUF805 domain-containing protein n=1 Tax=Halotalea alkalilenta TaxID=376489 RepID=A0A172YHA5_9GAMM|nr:hypothetical protein [Halotalea alkalilenta]ANF58639.1 hypothetical protein A5892_15145 [Halotalea alkalilenta]
MTPKSTFKLGLWPFLILNAVVAIAVVATHDTYLDFVQQVWLWLALTPVFCIALTARLRDIGLPGSWSWSLLSTLLMLCFLVEQPFAGAMGLFMWCFAAMTPGQAFEMQPAASEH